MIALRRIPRAEWEAILKSYGCKPLVGSGSLNTAEFWQMPWQSYPFTVPNEDGWVTQMDMDYLVRLIAESAPEGWEFDR